MLRRLDFGVRGQFGVTRLHGRSLSPPAAAFLELLTAHDRDIAALEQALLAAPTAGMPQPPSKARK